MLVDVVLVVSVAISEHVDVVFFFKQKTAYEMRISDWSSDVCSSDLRRVIQRNAYPLAPIVFPAIAWLIQYRPFWRLLPWGNNHPSWAEIRRDRKSVV